MEPKRDCSQITVGHSYPLEVGCASFAAGPGGEDFNKSSSSSLQPVSSKVVRFLLQLDDFTTRTPLSLKAETVRYSGSSLQICRSARASCHAETDGPDSGPEPPAPLQPPLSRHLAPPQIALLSRSAIASPPSAMLHHLE